MADVECPEGVRCYTDPLKFLVKNRNFAVVHKHAEYSLETLGH